MTFLSETTRLASERLSGRRSLTAPLDDHEIRLVLPRDHFTADDLARIQALFDGLTAMLRAEEATWAALKAKHLDDFTRCARCGAEATEVIRVDPAAFRRSDPTNLRGVCQPCATHLQKRSTAGEAPCQ